MASLALPSSTSSDAGARARAAAAGGTAAGPKEETLSSLLRSLNIGVDSGAFDNGTQGAERDGQIPRAPSLPLSDQLSLLSAHIDTIRASTAKTVSSDEGRALIADHTRRAGDVQRRLVTLEKRLQSFEDSANENTPSRSRQREEEEAPGGPLASAATTTTTTSLKTTVLRDLAAYTQAKQAYEREQHAGQLARLLRDAVAAVEQLEQQVRAEELDVQRLKNAMASADQHCAALGVPTANSTTSASNSALGAALPWAAASGSALPRSIGQLAARYKSAHDDVSQLLDSAWQDAIRVSPATEGKAAIRFNENAKAKSGTIVSTIQIARLSEALDERSELQFRIEALARAVLDDIVRAVLSSEVNIVWTERSVDEEHTWSIVADIADGHNTDARQSTVKVISNMLRQFKQHLFDRTSSRLTVNPKRIFSRTIVPPLITMLVSYIKTLFPDSLDLNTSDFEATENALKVLASLAREFYNCLEQEGYLEDGLREEAEDLLQLSASIGRQYLRHLGVLARSRCRDLLLKEQSEGWESLSVEMEVDVPAAQAAKALAQANAAEDNEVEHILSSVPGLTDAPPAQQAAKDDDAWDVWENNEDEKPTPAPSSPPVSTTSDQSKGRHKKSALGGVRVIKPQDELGSGPFPTNEDLGAAESGWGFDDDVIAPEAEAAAMHTSGTPGFPAEAEEDAWFQDEPIVEPPQAVPSDTQGAVSTQESRSFNMPDLGELDDDDIDEDAWGLTEEEKVERAAKRASIRASRGASSDLASAFKAFSSTQKAGGSVGTAPQPTAIATASRGTAPLASYAEEDEEQVGAADGAVPADAQFSVDEPVSAGHPVPSAPADIEDDAWGLEEPMLPVSAGTHAADIVAVAMDADNGPSNDGAQAPVADASSLFELPGTGVVASAPDASVPASMTLAKAYDVQEESVHLDAFAEDTDLKAPDASATVSSEQVGFAPTSSSPTPQSAKTIIEAAPLQPEAEEISDAWDLEDPPMQSESIYEERNADKKTPATAAAEVQPRSIGASPETADAPASSRSADAIEAGELGLRDEDLERPEVHSGSEGAATGGSGEKSISSGEKLSDAQTEPWEELNTSDGEFKRHAGADALASETSAVDQGNAVALPNPGPGAHPNSHVTSVESAAAVPAIASASSSPPAITVDAETNADQWGWNDDDAIDTAGTKPAVRSFTQQQSARSRSPLVRVGTPASATASPKLREATLRSASQNRSQSGSERRSQQPSRSGSLRKGQQAEKRPSSRASAQSTPAIQTEACLVSQRSLSFVQLVSVLLEDITLVLQKGAQNINTDKPVLEAKPLCDALTDVLDLHRALMPVGHAETLQNVPTLAAQFANDCVYIARELQRLQRRWLEAKSALPASDALRTLQDVSLEEHAASTIVLGQRSFDAQVLVQQRALAECLVETSGFEATYDDGRYQLCQRAMRQIVTIIKQLSAAWKPVLGKSRYLAVMGRIVDSVLRRVLRDVSSLADISEVEGNRLAELVRSLTELEGIFRADSIREEHGEAGAAATTTTSEVALHVPSWFKASYLCDILTGSLVDIEFLYFEAGALVDYAKPELLRLIRALFSDTPKRARLIERIQAA